MIKGWNYARGKVRVNEPSISSPTRGLMSRLVSYYRLLYSLKLLSWSLKLLSWSSTNRNEIIARIIPTFHHYGHELNSQIFLTIYFCTHFLRDKKFCINIFCITKFCTFISACVLSLLSKINPQIFVTQTIVMQKILMQKIMFQK